MAGSRGRNGRLAIELAVVALAIGGLALGLCGIRVSGAHAGDRAADDLARQVTVFGIIATPGARTTDVKLASIKTQLEKLLPKHGFRLVGARSNRVVAGESVGCDLDDGYTVVTSVVQPMDENGKVQLRCELFQSQMRQFSTLVSTPLNQLFFCQRQLGDGSQLLIGVAARIGVGGR
jgi:hypothetical protein